LHGQIDRAGTRILRYHLARHGGSVAELDMSVLDPTAVCEELVRRRATALLLLTSHPEPAVSLVRAVRRDQRLAEVLVGAPAGQPELPSWAALLGGDGAGVPFLRYLPERLGALGTRVEANLRERLDESPRSSPSRATTRSPSSPQCCAPRARTGHGSPRPGRVSRSRGPGGDPVLPNTGVGVWQWAWPPVQVVDRDPAEPERFRVLRSE
jgi:hypothetical protein